MCDLNRYQVKLLYITGKETDSYSEFILPFDECKITGIHAYVLPSQAQAAILGGIATAGYVDFKWRQVGDIFFSTPVIIQVDYSDGLAPDPNWSGKDFSTGGTKVVFQNLDHTTNKRAIEIHYRDCLNVALATNDPYQVKVTLRYER